jgi:predicted nucleic acid-binding Zn ribbon protein
MPSLGTSIKKLLREYGLEKPILEGSAINSWSEVVGESLAKNSRAVRIKGRTLYIKAKNAAWRNEIALQKDAILEEINNRTSNITLEDIIIR